MRTVQTFLIVISLFLCISVQQAFAQSTEVMTIDFGIDQGPVTYRASGFIGSISETQPPSSLLLPLKPKLLSWDRSYNGIQRALQNGMQYQIKLHNMGTIPASADGDWSAWEKLVRDRANEAKTNNYTNVEFDIWNEPEFSSYWSGPIDERYYQMWIRAYRVIKSVDPSFPVSGPNSTNYSWTMNTFLPRAKLESTLPDILTWHELWSNGSGVATRVENMRTYLLNNSMNISKISINEYNSSDTARRPGILLRFFYEFEKAKVYSAAKACWQEGGDWNCQVHLDNVLTYPDQQPRSAWWTYKSYADMTGTLVNVTNPVSFAGLASKDNTSKKGYILAGNFASSPSLQLTMTNVHLVPFYTSGKQIRANIYHIPNTETAALSAPILIQTVNVSPENNQATLAVSNVGLYDAYFITLESTSDSVSPTPTGPTSTPTHTPTPVPPTNTLTPVPPTATSTPTPSVPGDVTGDGIVNLSDLTVILSNFGKGNATRSQGDLNNDGLVNLTDLSLVLSNFGKTSVTPTPTDTSPIGISGWWKLDENTGQTITDSSGGGNNAVLGSTTSTETSDPVWTAGKYNSGLSFSNANGSIARAVNSTIFSFGENQDFTIGMWVKSSLAPLGGRWPTILHKDNNAGSLRQGYGIYLHNSSTPGWYFQIWVNGQAYTVMGAGNIADETWHHLAAVREGNNIRSYQDGILANTLTASNLSIANNTLFQLGGGFGSGNGFDGILDEIRVYNYARTQAQIQLDMSE